MLGNASTHFDQRHDFVKIVVLGLLSPYLVYNMASVLEVNRRLGDRPKTDVPRSCSRSSEPQNIGVSKAIGSDALIDELMGEKALAEAHAYQGMLTTLRRCPELPPT
jgi:hypothetical protein